MSGHTTVERIADVCLLLVYGSVIGFFVQRFLRHRRMPSVGIALMPLGWIYVALWDLGVLAPMPYAPIRWFGVVTGVFLLHQAMQINREDSDGPVRP